MELTKEQLERIEENRQRAQRIRESKKGNYPKDNDELFFIDTLDEEAPRCCLCTSLELDSLLLKEFGVHVCTTCKDSHPERFGLVIKTEARERYLLTEEELSDRTVLPCISRPNPHKSTWSDMQLYLREQLERFAIQKWGSLEAIEEEAQRREDRLAGRKEKRFKSKLSELKRKTLLGMAPHSPKKATPARRHVHEFAPVSTTIQECKTCGFRIESEEL